MLMCLMGGGGWFQKGGGEYRDEKEKGRKEGGRKNRERFLLGFLGKATFMN